MRHVKMFFETSGGKPFSTFASTDVWMMVELRISATMHEHGAGYLPVRPPI